MNALKDICRKIIAESSPKGRAKHPLYIMHLDEIVNLHDDIFGHKSNLSPSRKISSLANELEISENHETGITCACCNVYTRDNISQHIKLSHNLSITEYKERYSQEVISNKTKSIYGDRIRGDKNPAFNHGGKFSANSKNFFKYKDKSDNEVEQELAKVRAKISKSNRENGNNDTTLSYYTKQGYSIDEAKSLLSERQITFSLDKCIEKYGKDEGTKIWKERQAKWLHTLNDKTQDEIADINRKKGLTSEGTPHIGGFYNEGTLKKYPERGKHEGILYYLRFYADDGSVFWKIGITNKSIERRFDPAEVFYNKYKLRYDKIHIHKSNMKECFKLEQLILKENKQSRITINKNGFRTTEAFSKDIHESIRQYIS